MYTIISKKSITSLEREVEQIMARGYLPAGGVAVMQFQDDEHIYLQAMFKPEAVKVMHTLP